EGHRERDRNRQRHQQRRTPLPEPDQRDQDDQHHRFPEAAIEQIQLLAHLALLIGRRPDDQIGGQRASNLFYPCVDGGPESIDLLALLHLGGQRDRAASQPPAALVPPRVVRE